MANSSQIKSLFISDLSSEYKTFSFKKSTRFKYRFPKTIYFDEKSSYSFLHFALLTLHELGHALSHHKDYKIDIERLKIESEAWQRAKNEIKNHQKWQKKYQIFYDEDFVENELDSYRDWLHSRSKCKTCGLTRFQTKDGIYHCPECENFSE